MWSLGVILLEILTGIPIWMSLKCRTSTLTNKSQITPGIFAVQGRSGPKILAKQDLVFRNLN
jgi:dual specificity tyrosine-phosphorylation-regulated kinase 2/3/4